MEQVPDRNAEKIKSQEMARQAIELYLRLLTERIGKAHIFGENIEERAETDSVMLSSGNSLRYGSPTYGHLKLSMLHDPDSDSLSPDRFALFDNGLCNTPQGQEEFKEWDQFIGGEFEKAGLKYVYRSKK